jgi:hypothetical protein
MQWNLGLARPRDRTSSCTCSRHVARPPLQILQRTVCQAAIAQLVSIQRVERSGVPSR